jgi:hypothetical protein
MRKPNLSNSPQKMNEINGGIPKVSTIAMEFSNSARISFAGTLDAAAYSPFPRSNTHLVYTTEHLRPRAVEVTHFFSWMTAENSDYALPIA